MKMFKPLFSFCCLTVILLLTGSMANAQSVVIEHQEAPKKIKPGEFSYVNAFPFDHFLGFQQKDKPQKKSRNFFDDIGKDPGLSFLSSALVPGLGQAAHHQWIKAGIFAAIEAVTLYSHFHLRNEGRNLEDQYIKYADGNWSVVNYATYLVNYHNHYFPNDKISLNSLANQGYNLTTGPDYSHQDWQRVNLEKLHQLENMTYYDGTSGVPFSHNMPDYGSQQYYELMSKYFQFSPGWRDFTSKYPINNGTGTFTPPVWSLNDMPPLFLQGAKMANEYNNKFRMATNVLTITIINHFVSAFDAFITTKLRTRNLHVETNGLGAKLVYGF